MKNLTDYPLKIKLLLVPAIAVVSFGVYLTYSSLLLSDGDDLLKQIDHSEFPRIYVANENIKSFDGVLESLKTASSTGEVSYLNDANAKADEILRRFDALKQIDDKHKQQIAQLKAGFSSFYALAFVIAQEMTNKTALPGNQQIKQMQILRDTYAKESKLYRDSAEQEFKETIRQAIENSERAQVTGVVIGIVMLFVVVLLTILVNRGIVLLEKTVEDRNKRLMIVNDELEHEIENLKAAELAKNYAEEASQIKDQFLANMSHELRTPMNAVIGLSHLCLQSGLSEKQRDYIQKINSSAKSLLGILNDILDISKIEAGKMELDKIPFEVAEEIDNILTIFGDKAKEKNIELILQCSPEIPSIMIGDPLRLGQVLINLVGNAVKFTAQGDVLVSAELVQQIGTYVELKFTVKDTGIGLSQAEIDKLFHPFTQADSSITRKFGGTGLGLTISKRLVELMGGVIWIESEPGLGSKFIFTAKFLKADKLSFVPQTQFVALRGLRVLAADNNENSLLSLKNYLQSFSLDVIGVSTGRDAISAIRIANKDRRPISLIIVKRKLPDIYSLDLVKEIRSITDLTLMPKVLLVADYGDNDTIAKIDTRYFDGIVEKPIHRQRLFDTIAKIIGGDHSITGRFRAFDVKFNMALVAQVSGARILLVEDNEINQLIAKEMLENFEIDVTIADNGAIAIEQLKQEQFDGVLMDIQMPIMDGVTATREIRKIKEWADLPIIALTANVYLNEKNEFLAAGMNDHIGKPIDPDQMLVILAKWIRPNKTSKVTNVPPPNKAVQSLTLPELPGVKVAESIRRMGGNVKLYYALLDKFNVQQIDTVQKIRVALLSKDLKLAERVAHTLKGTAGNLGAELLQKQAEQLENIFKHNTNTDIESLLGSIDQEINQLIANFDNALKLNLQSNV